MTSYITSQRSSSSAIAWRSPILIVVYDVNFFGLEAIPVSQSLMLRMSSPDIELYNHQTSTFHIASLAFFTSSVPEHVAADSSRYLLPKPIPYLPTWHRHLLYPGQALRNASSSSALAQQACPARNSSRSIQTSTTSRLSRRRITAEDRRSVFRSTRRSMVRRG